MVINGNSIFDMKKNRGQTVVTPQKPAAGSSAAGDSGSAGKTLGKPTGGTTYIGADGMKKQGVYLDDAGRPDIGVQIDDAINRGLSYQDVERLLNQRNEKISSTPGLDKYANDAISQRAQSYINQGKSAAQLQEMRDYYAQIAAQQEAAKRAAVEQTVGRLEGQKGTVSQSYDDLMRQLYIDRRKAEKNLPQQMAAMGYTGGLTESSALGLQTGYAEALRQGEQQKTTTLSDIDRAISDARLSGEISIAEQAAQLAQQGLLSYTDLIRAQQEQANWEKRFGFEQGQFDWQKAQGAQNQSNYEQEMAYQKEQDALTWAYKNNREAYERAMTKWQLTGVLDEESAAILGLPAGTKTTDYAYQLAQMAKLSAGGRSGGTKEAEYYDPELLYEAAMKSGDPVGYIYSNGAAFGFKTQEEKAYAIAQMQERMSDPRYATVDINSVLQLMEGAISPERLAEMEARGEIESYVEDGKIKYRRRDAPYGGSGMGLGSYRLG